jgi:XTP/dITP diphosphohydrolase
MKSLFRRPAVKKVLVASNNPGKIREIGGILADLDIEVMPQRTLGIEDADETGVTFIENALIKARHATRCSGLPAIADDSGLEVDALGGRPGVYSARFAGANATDSENNLKLIESLRDLGGDAFSARFRCVMVFLRHPEDPSPVIGQGVWEGEIILSPKGDGGFGYDPYFWVPEAGLTVSEMTDAEKNRQSHRGKALNALINALRADHA